MDSTADDVYVSTAAGDAREDRTTNEDRKPPLIVGTHQGIAIVTAYELTDRLKATLVTWRSVLWASSETNAVAHAV
jgi:hypothetical protein